MNGDLDAKCIAKIDRMMSDVLKKFPKTVDRFMRAQARQLRNEAKKTARSKVKRRTGNYLRGFTAGKQVYEWNDAEYNIRVYNKAPHGHLIELGHRQIGHRPGKMRGAYVKGREVLNQAHEAFAETFARNIENDLIDMIIKELEK